MAWLPGKSVCHNLLPIVLAAQLRMPQWVWGHWAQTQYAQDLELDLAQVVGALGAFSSETLWASWVLAHGGSHKQWGGIGVALACH